MNITDAPRQQLNDVCDEIDGIAALPAMGDQDWQIAGRVLKDLTKACREYIARWLPEAAEEIAAGRGHIPLPGARNGTAFVSTEDQGPFLPANDPIVMAQERRPPIATLGRREDA